MAFTLPSWNDIFNAVGIKDPFAQNADSHIKAYYASNADVATREQAQNENVKTIRLALIGASVLIGIYILKKRGKK